MEIIHDWENGPEVLFIRGLDISDAKKEAEWTKPILKKPQETGTAYEDNEDIPRKDNRGIFFEEIYTPMYSNCSPIGVTFQKVIETLQKQKFTLNSVFNKVFSMSGFNVLLSAYKNNDYYKPHRDSSGLTMLLWLGEKNFKGGDLILNDFNYTIPYEEGLISVFPSYYMHEVTKVKTKEKDYVRYCATAFVM